MTVLLIDGVGRVREWEIPDLVPVLEVPVPVPFLARWDPEPAALFAPIPRAVFQLSAELSLPPAYRFAGVRA
jgi:hypothetical protein